MPDQPKNSKDLVERKLRRAWRKERRFYHTRGISVLVVWLVAMILLDLLVDWMFRLAGWGRLTLLAVNLVTLGVVVYRYWLRHLVAYDPVRVALEVEDRHPELRSVLVSYVQVGRGASQDASASPALIAALRRQAVDVTRPLDFREIISYRQLRRMAGLSLAVVAFFAAVSVNWSDMIGTLLVRLLNPSSQVAYPTRTRIVEITGDATVQQGKSIALSARCAGSIPRKATLYIQPEGVKKGKWESRPLLSSGTDSFGYEFPDVFQSFRYKIEAGDAGSAEYAVSVVPAPHIVASVVRLKYPEYTHRQAKSVDTLNLEVPEGTQIEWELKLDRPLMKAEIIRPRPTRPTATMAASPAPAPTTQRVANRPGPPRPFVRPAPRAPLKLPAKPLAGVMPRGGIGAGAAAVTTTASAPATAPAPPAAAPLLGPVMTEVEMAVDDDGLTVRWRVRADESFPYHFRWTDAEHEYVYEEDVRYDLAVLGDNPPEVEIVFPALDEKATVRKKLTIDFHARDDFQVAKAFIVYTVNGGPEQTQPILITPAPEISTSTTWTLKDSIPAIAEGDIITYAVVVADNRNDSQSAQVKRSASRQLTIVSVPEYLSYILEKASGTYDEVKALREQETEASKQVQTLKTGAPASQPSDRR